MKKQVLTAPDIVLGARRLIAVGPWDTPAVQGVDAINEDGAACLVTDPRARRFSTLGALLLAARHSDWEELARAINAVARAIGVTTDIDLDTRKTYEAIRAWEDSPGRTIADVNCALGLAWKETRDGKQEAQAA